MCRLSWSARVLRGFFSVAHRAAAATFGRAPLRPDSLRPAAFFGRWSKVAAHLQRTVQVGPGADGHGAFVGRLPLRAAAVAVAEDKRNAWEDVPESKPVLVAVRPQLGADEPANLVQGWGDHRDG